MKFGKILGVAGGVAAAGVVGFGVKKAVDYFKKKDEEEETPVVSNNQEEIEVTEPTEELAYAVVEPSSVQDFLDKSFGDEGRYVPNSSPKIFDYQDQEYMVIWAFDNKNQKNQLLAFEYTDEGRKMRASVGYTGDATDYNITLDGTPFAIEVNGEQITSGQGNTDGTEQVDFVLAG